MLTNLYDALPVRPTAEEEISELLVQPGLRIERIVSTGQASPPGFWFDQPTHEWVTVLSGEARLRFADEDAARILRAGDFLPIPAHRKHRVEWTHPEMPTIWLAIHHD